MYLSRIQLRLAHLTPDMVQKWNSAASYASHQWLWQLFPDRETRSFLFRQEDCGRFYLLSTIPPLAQHNFFSVETRPFSPQLENGLLLDFQLRANPVITRNRKRSDVMMDAKYQAKAKGIAREKWWEMQLDAALAWLEKQGNQHGFNLIMPLLDDFTYWSGADYNEADGLIAAHGSMVKACQQHRFVRRVDEKSIAYSSVDYLGTLRITDVSLFQQALFHGIGKSKALGCGLLMVKRKR